MLSNGPSCFTIPLVGRVKKHYRCYLVRFSVSLLLCQFHKISTHSAAAEDVVISILVIYSPEGGSDGQTLFLRCGDLSANNVPISPRFHTKMQQTSFLIICIIKLALSASFGQALGRPLSLARPHHIPHISCITNCASHFIIAPSKITLRISN